MNPKIKTSLIAVASAALGAALTFGGIKYKDHQESKSLNSAKIERVEDMFDHMLKDHNSFQQRFGSIFNDDFFKQTDSWFSGKSGGVAGTEAVTDIQEREDADNVYYDIKVDDVIATSINTDIKDGQITITGTTEKKSGDGSSEQSLFKSTFQRSFPLPDGIDEHKMTMTTENNKVVLKFPKLKV